MKSQKVPGRYWWSFFFYVFYLLIFGCTGSLLLGTGFLQLQRVGGFYLQCTCFSCCRAQSLIIIWLSVVAAHRLSCSTACEIFPGQGSNPCPLHWQADSYPLDHQRSPVVIFSQSVSSVAQWCPTLCNPNDCSMPGFLVPHHLPEFTQTHVHQVGDAIQPSHPLLSPSPPTFNLSQYQGLFK